MEASTPTSERARRRARPRADAAANGAARARRAAEPGRDRRPEVRHQRPALPPRPAPRDLDVEAEGAQLLHRGAQLAARAPTGTARHFDPGARVRGESSPNYTAYPHHLGVPERMHSVIPDAKLIYVVRDPLLRIASHWVHNYAKRREKGDLRDDAGPPQHLLPAAQPVPHAAAAVPAPLPARADPGPRSRATSAATAPRRLRQVFEFVGVDPDFTHPSFERERHATARKTRATRLAARLERMSKTRRGRLLPPKVWFALDERLPLRRPIERPDVREALDRRGAAGAARGRRAPARADRPRLRRLVDLGGMSSEDAGRRPGPAARRCPASICSYSGVQGVALVGGNLLQLAIDRASSPCFLGPSDLGPLQPAALPRRR